MKAQAGRGGRMRSRGQSLVEMAVAVPILLTLVLGSMDVGRAFYYREAVANSARQALRVAVNGAQQATGNTACSGHGGSPQTLSATLPPSGSSTISTIATDVALESSSDGTAAGTVLNGATLAITWHCSSGSAVTNATATSTDPANSGSDSISVTITYGLHLLTPFAYPFTAGGTFNIAVTATGRTEY